MRTIPKFFICWFYCDCASVSFKFIEEVLFILAHIIMCICCYLWYMCVLYLVACIYSSLEICEYYVWMLLLVIWAEILYVYRAEMCCLQTVVIFSGSLKIAFVTRIVNVVTLYTCHTRQVSVCFSVLLIE